MDLLTANDNNGTGGDKPLWERELEDLLAPRFDEVRGEQTKTNNKVIGFLIIGLDAEYLNMEQIVSGLHSLANQYRATKVRKTLVKISSKMYDLKRLAREIHGVNYCVLCIEPNLQGHNGDCVVE